MMESRHVNARLSQSLRQVVRPWPVPAQPPPATSPRGVWRPQVLSVACETEGANALALSIAAGKQVHLESITSLAKSLGSPYPIQQLLDHCLEHPSRVAPWVCSDAQAVAACLAFAEHHRVLVEPACGAALAAVYNRHAQAPPLRATIPTTFGPPPSL